MALAREHRIESADDLTGPQRSAVLLMYLDPAASQQMLEHLDTDELEAIGEAMADLDAIPSGVIEAVVAEFVRDLRETAMIPRPGREFALGVLPELIDDRRRPEVVSTLKRRVSTAFADFVADRAPSTVATVLREEHPQTRSIALLLMGTENAARVLECLDDHERFELCMRMARVKQIPNDIAEEVEAAITRSLATGTRRWEARGLDLAAQTLGQMGSSSRDALLERFASIDEALSQKLRRRMLPFEQLAELDDRTIQTLLRHVDRDRLTQALRGVASRVQARFLQNMSKRAAADLQDDLDLPSSAPPSEFRRAREEIVQTAFRLQEEGVLRLGLGDDEDIEEEVAAK